MPRMNGVQLLEALSGLHPGLPVLLMTGYAMDALREQGISVPCGVLAKPFAPEHLLSEVQASRPQLKRDCSKNGAFAGLAPTARQAEASYAARQLRFRTFWPSGELGRRFDLAEAECIQSFPRTINQSRAEPWITRDTLDHPLNGAAKLAQRLLVCHGPAPSVG
jgi:CheY-like chemotaxis protein